MRQFSQLTTRVIKFFFIDKLLKMIESSLLLQLFICFVLSLVCLHTVSDLYKGTADEFVIFYGEKLRGFYSLDFLL